MKTTVYTSFLISKLLAVVHSGVISLANIGQTASSRRRELWLKYLRLQQRSFQFGFIF
jgi:hypothetical protein